MCRRLQECTGQEFTDLSQTEGVSLTFWFSRQKLEYLSEENKLLQNHSPTLVYAVKSARDAVSRRRSSDVIELKETSDDVVLKRWTFLGKFTAYFLLMYNLKRDSEINLYWGFFLLFYFSKLSWVVSGSHAPLNEQKHLNLFNVY